MEKKGWLGLIPHSGSDLIINNVFNIKARVLFGKRQVAVKDQLGKHCCIGQGIWWW